MKMKKIQSMLLIICMNLNFLAASSKFRRPEKIQELSIKLFGKKKIKL